MALPKCVRINAYDDASGGALVKDGWREIETLVLLERVTEEMGYSDKICPLNEGDMEATVELARNNMGPNRFISDGLLDETVAMDIREEWIRKSPENVTIFGDDKDVFGFLVEDQNHLALLTVDHRVRMRGIGKRLTQAFIQRAFEAGYKKVMLGTQATNLPALMLYWGLGFEIVGKSRTFHKG